MNIFQIAGLGICCTMIYVMLKQQNSSIGFVVVIAFGVCIFLPLMERIVEILEVFRQISDRAGANTVYLAIICKMIGIAALAEISAQICRDGGSGAIAAKIEFAAKIIMLTLAIPILTAILDCMLDFIP